jgi:hypothetical protein
MGHANLLLYPEVYLFYKICDLNESIHVVSCDLHALCFTNVAYAISPSVSR